MMWWWHECCREKGAGKDTGGLGRKVTESHTETQVTFEQRPEGGEGVNQVDSYEKRHQGEGTAYAKVLR